SYVYKFWSECTRFPILSTNFRTRWHSLKSKYQGILLAATAIDTLGCLFPVAHAVVVAEDDENWFWFLQHLRQIIQDHVGQFLQPNILTLFSDRQKSLINSIDKVFPNSP